MKLSSVFALLASIASTQAVLDGPCSGFATGGLGVCISTAACSKKGGTSTPGHCPGTANDIQCCTKSSCTSAAAGGGVCRFTSSCTGNHFVITDLCPGPSDFTCCVACAPGRRDESSGELDKRVPVCPG
ncbi:hypothetical protein C8F04DRAFT_1160503 [Mycena alexandri]|uniref:Uncharacterized protein n=1 Tax=Mycena alexandri TaxID=1745969 RepID=A0AAD6RYC9_9AGAR|nr:hypothetical protein C8F04DRAFT_1160503 [Mycena alexandri]